MVFCWRSGVSLLFKTFTSVSFITVFSQRRRPRDSVLITPNKNLQKLLNGLLEFFRLSDNFCVMLVAWRAARRWSGICKQNNLYEISQASITQPQKFDDIQAGLHQAARSHKVHFSEWSRAFNGLREISQSRRRPPLAKNSKNYRSNANQKPSFLQSVQPLHTNTLKTLNTQKHWHSNTLTL